MDRYGGSHTKRMKSQQMRKWWCRSKESFAKKIWHHTTKRIRAPKAYIQTYPYAEKLIRPNSKAKYLRQSATLTAFGDPVFNKPIENIAAIYAIFKRAVGDNLSEGAVCSMYEEFPAIDVTNRYFTPKGGADSQEIRPLTAEVDPNGYLAKVAGSTYVHTEENKVYYFEKAGNGKG